MKDSRGLCAPDADEMRLRAAQAMAAGLLRTVRIAAALVAAGRTVDLDGIDDLIGRLCARALDLPPEQGLLLTDDLRRLLTESDTLHARLSGRELPPPLMM
jgi:hypothetical protein